SGDFDAEAPRQTHHVAKIAPDLRRIDVDGPNRFESGPLRHLLDDRRSDRTESEVHHANVRHKRELYSPSMAADHPGGLTREHVVWAYRLLLDREPENDDVIAPKLAGSRDTRELRRHLITSSEFREKNPDFAHTNDSTVVIKEIAPG